MQWQSKKHSKNKICIKKIQFTNYFYRFRNYICHYFILVDIGAIYEFFNIRNQDVSRDIIFSS